MSRKIRILKYTPPVPSAIWLFFHGINFNGTVVLILRIKQYIDKKGFSRSFRRVARNGGPDAASMK